MKLQNLSYTYSEELTLKRVTYGRGYNGKWAVVRYVQKSVYPWILRGFPPPVEKVVPIKGFGTFKCRARAGSNILTNVCTGKNIYLDVYNNRVGHRASGRWTGHIKGNMMVFRFDPNNRLSPELRGRIGKGGKINYTLKIVPWNKTGRDLFNTERPGKLELRFRAEVNPPDYADAVVWHVPPIGDSKITVEPANRRGRNIKIIYTGLPSRNSAFGLKKIKAVLDIENCHAEDTSKIKIFYHRDVKNNPEGKYPNWFYYWKQTPCANPYGQNPTIEYGGSQFSYCNKRGVLALFSPGYAYKTIHVCDLTKTGPKMRDRFPLISHKEDGTGADFDGWRITHYIDTFAVVVLHEFKHWQMYHAWKRGKSNAQLASEDRDRDGIPDRVEPGLGFNPLETQTYYALGELKGIGYDEEWLAYEEMRKHRVGSCNRYDWSYPGSQWH